MRFRLADVSDVPAMTDLYAGYVLEVPPVYPKSGDEATIRKEWSIAQCLQLAGNPNGYFAVVGVVKSSMIDGKVIGGKAKAMITIFLTTRPMGSPKRIAFCEMMIVDPKFRGREVAVKLTMIACRYAQLQGAEVFEASWRSGSAVGESWKQVGMVPYQETGAWVLSDGTPRTGIIFDDRDLISEPGKDSVGDKETAV